MATTTGDKGPSCKSRHLVVVVMAKNQNHTTVFHNDKRERNRYANQYKAPPPAVAAAVTKKGKKTRQEIGQVKRWEWLSATPNMGVSPGASNKEDQEIRDIARSGARLILRVGEGGVGHNSNPGRVNHRRRLSTAGPSATPLARSALLV